MPVDLRYHFIRTPLERPLMGLRRAFEFHKRIRHPELMEIYREGARVEAVLRRILGERTCCLDIGAHYGSMLSAFLRAAPLGRHVAVEAVPQKVEFLRRKFPEVEVHNVALAEEPGTVDFFVNTRRSGFSGLAPQRGAEDDVLQAISVKCETLDRLCADLERIDFVKIDVEGAEEMVLRGGLQFLRFHRPRILFECGPAGPRAYGRTPDDLYQLLTGTLGYDVFLLKDWLADRPPIDRDGFSQALVYPFKAFNWLATCREAASN